MFFKEPSVMRPWTGLSQGVMDKYMDMIYGYRFLLVWNSGAGVSWRCRISLLDSPGRSFVKKEKIS